MTDFVLASSKPSAPLKPPEVLIRERGYVEPFLQKVDAPDSFSVADVDDKASTRVNYADVYLSLVLVFMAAYELCLRMQSIAKQRSAEFSLLTQEQSVSRKEATVSSANKDLSGAALNFVVVAAWSVLGGAMQYKSTVEAQNRSALLKGLESSPSNTAVPPRTSLTEDAVVAHPKLVSTSEDALPQPLSQASTSRAPAGGVSVEEIPQPQPRALSRTDANSTASPSDIRVSNEMHDSVASRAKPVDTQTAADLPEPNRPSQPSELSSDTIREFSEHADALGLEAAKHGALGSVLSASAMSAGAVFTAGLHVASTQDRADSELLANSANNTNAARDTLEKAAQTSADSAARALGMASDVLKSSESMGRSAAQRI
jgi:hypothetical protein